MNIREERKKRRIERLSDFRYVDFYLLAFSLIIFGMLVQPLPELSEGLIKITRHPSILLSDYMVIGGVGASFVNSGMLLLLSVFWADQSGTRITGALIASFFIVAGFSLFGKNIFNSIPLMLGVRLYIRLKGLDVKNYMHIICFVTGMSPIVSLFMYGLGYPILKGAIFGVIAGLLVGFIIIPLSISMLKFHDGYSLYNVGFTLGIIGVAIAGFLRMFDIDIPAQRIVNNQNDMRVILFLIYLNTALILYGLISNKGFKGYDKILKSSGKLVTDYTIEAGKPLTLLNMGVMGLVAIGFVWLSGGIFNGPIVGGIFTVMGFAAFGKQPKNVIPVMLGVFIASILNKYDPSSTEAVLTALFSSTLAPVAGEFGILAGILAGFVHKSVATNVGVIHGGINLYNNGFAGGIVAALLVPLFKNFNERYERD